MIMETTGTMAPTLNQPRKKLFLSVLMVGMISLSACSDSVTEDVGGKPAAEVEEIKGSELKRVTLTKEAAERIDLKTEKVKKGLDGIEIPYGSVLYDPNGMTWVFVNTTGLSFERKAITVARIVGDVVYLTSGPDVGATVVTLGAVQLYGAEIGVGDE